MEESTEIAIPKAGRTEPLGWQAARTLYNLVDARWPAARGRDPAPALVRELRHAGVWAIRGLRFWVFVLDVAPLLRGQGRFWRLPREARLRAAARFEGSRIGPRRAAWKLVANAVEKALAADQPA